MKKVIKKIGHGIETVVINPTIVVATTAYKVIDDVCEDIANGVEGLIDAEKRTMKKIIEK